ncbi:hypothetical protein SAMN03159428_05361 [Kosakonia radicincitans]|uniref:Uncharacterized protein n=2 Tax=Kosakonia radicincitans TaxID=283686 RepID=A0AAX2F0H8_9ENTR|nr:hypothetical protein SAMN03159468_04901 [Kosakonia radicincitans]SFR27712.1 hypothetical protein SAMN03159514_05374 [Kosakonia radicincitans]SFU19430.1 hypothetical protein SAMN03159428_05361 [Kosakonia radicincitans]SFY31642.1 hypothetical protein SAMN03159436_04851 [Kosakonia radicincitans]
MHTHNVNVKTATEESSRKMGVKKPSHLLILLAEGEKNSQEEMDVMEFGSLAALKDYRRRNPEKMKGVYHYIVSAGTDKNSRHVEVVGADHFRQFVRQIERMGISI